MTKVEKCKKVKTPPLRRGEVVFHFTVEKRRGLKAQTFIITRELEKKSATHKESAEHTLNRFPPTRE
tara:strand:- start:1013 stop:1213 length:201 start_codon:yes stop_codon:yes gene_type:complete